MRNKTPAASDPRSETPLPTVVDRPSPNSVPASDVAAPIEGVVLEQAAPPVAEEKPFTAPEPVASVSDAEAMTLALTPPQRTAIILLTSGHTLVASATAAGVNRTTLYRWLKGDSAFLAAFNAWQKDVIDTARGRILALSDLAVNTVAKAMTKGDASTAMKVLGAIGALDRVAPGSTDPDEIKRVQKLEKMKSQTALRKAEARAEMESYEPL